MVRWYLALRTLRSLRRIGCLVIVCLVAWQVLGASQLLHTGTRAAVGHEVWRGLDRAEGRSPWR
jgi:hypothetical protein